jgi:hypothetical protein
LPEKIRLKDFSVRSTRQVKPKSGVGPSIKESVRKNIPKLITVSNLKILFLSILVLAGLVVCFYYLTRSAFPNKIEKEQVKETSQVVVTQDKKPDNKNTVYLATSVINGPLEGKASIDFVPYDADLYANFNSVDLAGKYFGFLGIGFVSFVEDNSKDLGPSYCFFSKNIEGVNNMVFIFFPTNQDMKLKDYAGWKAQKVREALVFSENQNLLTDVVSSKDGLIKNLSLNPVFASIRTSVPLEGKAFLMVLNGKGSETLDYILARTTSEDLKSIIEAYKKLDSNYLIVK